MAPPTPTTTPMMIFLSDSDTPLLLAELSPASEGEVVSAGAEVVVITVGIVLPLTVSKEVMVLTTGFWVVELVSDVVEVSEVVLVGSVFEEVVEVSEVVEVGVEDEVVGVVSLVGVGVSEGVADVEEVVVSVEVVGSGEELVVVSVVRAPNRSAASAL